jgi:flagellar basal body-associated protein FliL
MKRKNTNILIAVFSGIVACALCVLAFMVFSKPKVQNNPSQEIVENDDYNVDEDEYFEDGDDPDSEIIYEDDDDYILINDYPEGD